MKDPFGKRLLLWLKEYLAITYWISKNMVFPLRPRIEGRGIKEVWCFDTTFVFMALWLWSFKFGDSKRTDLMMDIF